MTELHDPTPTDPPPPERVRVATPNPARRPVVAPMVYLAGLVVLAVAVFFLWRYPTTPRRVADDSNRLTAVQAQVETLSNRVAQLDGRKEPDIGPLEARVARLESRTGPDLGPLEARITRLENRPAPAPTDLSGVNSRLEALTRDAAAAAAKQEGEIAALRTEVGSTAGGLGKQLSAVDTRVAAVERDEKDVTALAGRAQRTARVQAAAAALDAGKPLGPIPDAPPALARFATTPPPTDAALRLSFPDAAAAAQRASEPAVTDEKNFLQRAWTRAQGAVTVRQGDRVVLGDPIAGVLAHAQTLLDAGDLSGCLRVLDARPGGLAGPAQAAMADWTAQAQALVDARAALASMAGG